jgi:hypothetical protein
VVLFTAGLLFEASASAGIRHRDQDATPVATQQIELRIVPREQIHAQDAQRQQALDDSGTRGHTVLKPGAATRIFAILDSHYTPKQSDPGYITDDLKQIANYYSEFPEVIALLKPLKNKHWDLYYDADTWDTVAIGNAMEVDKAVIHFNTRAAAQLLLNRQCTDNPVCIASPADALLHELLHAHSMLVDTAQFIDEGGMNNVLYPYEHEYAVIDAERKLYASMSRRDDIKRPQRTDHTGRTVLARCPICIK